MRGREERGPQAATIVYCVVPRELAGPLHDSLVRHFRSDQSVEVVVERREDDRRRGDRREEGAVAGAPGGGPDRREIRTLGGRRAADRRAPVLAVDAPELPRRARAHAAQLTFIERLAPTGVQEEDADSARLVALVHAGDQGAFPELYMRYFGRVYRYMRMVLDDPAEAEDVTQQVFLRVWQALPSYELRDRPFRAWLFTVARNCAISGLRRRGRAEVVPAADLDRQRESAPTTEAEERTLNWLSDADLLLLVERLPLVQRQVLMLRYLADLSTPDIAAVLGRSSTDVRTLEYRARRFLRDRLRALGRESEGGRFVRMRRWGKPATVIRQRRFALIDT